MTAPTPPTGDAHPTDPVPSAPTGSTAPASPETASVPQAPTPAAPAATPGATSEPAPAAPAQPGAHFSGPYGQPPSDPAPPAVPPTGEGAPVPPAPAGPGFFDRLKEPKLRRRVIWIGSAVGAIVVLLIAAAIVIGQINQRVHGPEARVREYLAALEEGSASEAIEMISTSSGTSASDALSDAVYAETPNRPTGAQITGTTIGGTYATVDVKYTQGGREVTEQFSLERRGKNGLFDIWRITIYSTGELFTSSSNSGTVLLNGVEIEVGSTNSMSVFPGEYTVTLPESKYVDASTETVTVYGSELVTVPRLTTQINSTFESEAKKLMDTTITECMSSTELEPEGCPNSTYTSQTINDVKWTLDTAPTFTYSEGLDANSFRVRSDNGRATVSGTYGAGSYAEGEAYSSTYSLYISGTITIDGDKLTYTSGY